MSAALLLVVLGGMPCLPEEIGQFPPEPLPPPVAEAPALVALPAPPIPVKPTPPPNTEASRYRVMYGLLGELGHIEISFLYPAPGEDTVKAVGVGSGSLMGMGQYEKRLESQLDSRRLTSRRWVSRRVQSGKTTTDTVEQPRPGAVEVVRQRSDKPDEGHTFVRQQPVLDPLGFLYRVRSRPPRAPEAYEVLDGRALWLITLEPGTPAKLDGGRRAVAFRGRANPIFWDGQRDGERSARSFTLWLSDDRYRTPLRLVMPLPVGEVRVDLAALDRPATATAPGDSVASRMLKTVRVRPGLIARPVARE
jgi:hypothetical protein